MKSSDGLSDLTAECNLVTKVCWCEDDGSKTRGVIRQYIEDVGGLRIHIGGLRLDG